MSINIPKGNYDGMKYFDGTPWFNLVGMYYLTRKYKNNCVIIPYKKKPNDHTDVSIRWIQTKGDNGYLHVPKNFWKEFKRHLDHSHDKGFIVFPFGFSCLKSGGHANYMLYDIKNKTLERFDSLGKVNSKCLKAKDLDKKIVELFKDKMGEDFIKKYLKPFTKYKIFQELQDMEKVKKLQTDPKYGFCSVWACWWTDLRLSNPNHTRDELVEISLEKLLKEKSLTSFIRKYSQNIIEHSKNVQSCLNITVPEYKPETSKRKSRKSRRRKTKSKRKSNLKLWYYRSK